MPPNFANKFNGLEKFSVKKHRFVDDKNVEINKIPDESTRSYAGISRDALGSKKITRKNTLKKSLAYTSKAL
ncbi:MAG: hypothetical protein IJT59_03580 [Desulfovibrionaceae bacterium]|nr:hypothetical protein [Desulfovibrionaceae bacterium]